MAGGQCCSSSYFGIGTRHNMEVYDPGTGAWTLSGSTDLDYVKKVVSLPNGQVLVGGYIGYEMFDDGFHPVVQLYNPATGIWTATSTPGSDLSSSYVLPYFSYVLSAAHVIPLADSRVLFIASCSVDGTAAGIIYDPTTNSWTSAGPCADDISLDDSYTATLLSNGKVLLAGYGSGAAQLYDPSTNSWTTTSPMNEARRGQSATLLPDGKVLVAGGSGSNGNLASAELYDPSSGTWTMTGSMNEARVFSSATLLLNGKVLVTGPTNSAELYDPETGTWATTTPMADTHPQGTKFNGILIYNNSSILLPNGQVLVEGELNAGYLATSSAELYGDPINLAPVLHPIGNQTVLEGQTLSFTVSATDLDRDTLTYSASNLPPGASFDPATHTFTWTPNYGQAGNYTNVEFTVTDSGTPQLSANENVTITAVVSQPLLASSTLPAAVLNVPYSQSLSASGGQAPYTFSITSGALPPGLSLDPATGIISGISTAVSTSTFTVQVQDAQGQTSAAAFTLVTIYPPVIITTSSLPAGTVGATYSQTLQATSGTPPYTWGVTAGALPVGMNLSSTGTISGTPTVPGLYTFTVEAVDANVQLATQTLTITVNPAPAITTTSLPQSSVNEAYSQTILTTGGTQPFAWSITAGALPPGLSLDPSAGTISGTPTASGTYHFTVRLTDAYSVSVSKALDIPVSPALNINTNALPRGKVGNPYSKTVVAIGGIKPYTWSVSDGSLPPGLALDPVTGIVSGTPTSAGTYSVAIQVTDANAQATSTAYTLKITSLSITTATLPKGVVGAAYTKNLAATGGTTPYSWSLISGNLPPGLALDTSGALTGTPTAAGAFTFTVQVSDVNGQIDTSTYTATTTQTSIVTGALPNGKVGNAYSKTLVANSGTAPYAWSIIGGALPAGLSLSADGVISGTPTTAGTAGVTVQVTDANGIFDSQIYGLKVNP